MNMNRRSWLASLFFVSITPYAISAPTNPHRLIWVKHDWSFSPIHITWECMKSDKCVGGISYSPDKGLESYLVLLGGYRDYRNVPGPKPYFRTLNQAKGWVEKQVG